MNPITQAGHELGLFRQLKARKYDLVIHLTEHPRGAWLTRLLKPKYSVAQRAQGINEGRDSRLWKKSFTHTFPSPRATFRHTVESNLDSLRRLGIYPQAAEKKLVLVPGDEAEKKVESLMALHNISAKRFIHMHPTSRWFFKTWPAEKFAQLILEIGKAGERVVLTAAPTSDEREMVAAIKKLLKAPVVDLTGSLTLKELAALTSRCTRLRRCRFRPHAHGGGDADPDRGAVWPLRRATLGAMGSEAPYRGVAGPAPHLPAVRQ